MAAALSTNSGNPGGSHYEERRTCALAAVSATPSFLLSPTDASSALNAELTLSFENLRYFPVIYALYNIISIRNLSLFPHMLHELYKLSILRRFIFF